MAQISMYRFGESCSRTSYKGKHETKSPQIAMVVFLTIHQELVGRGQWHNDAGTSAPYVVWEMSLL